MGYESRVIVVNVNRFKEENGHLAWTYGEEIAAIKMSCMSSGFRDIFTKEIDYEICEPGQDKLT